MKRSNIYFIISAVLSLFVFSFKSDHLFDYFLVVSTGLFFLISCLLAFRPSVKAMEQLQFVGIGLVIWLILFSLCFNLLFFVSSPFAGLLGAWLISTLAIRLLGLDIQPLRPILLTGFAMPLIGVLFAMAIKEFPLEVSIGMKAGVITALWQVGVGIQMVKNEVTDDVDSRPI